MAKFCFKLGMVCFLAFYTFYMVLIWQQAMKRVEVIADDEDEIIEAVRRMSNNYDFVVTSGGIGPTFGPRQG